MVLHVCLLVVGTIREGRCMVDRLVQEAPIKWVLSVILVNRAPSSTKSRVALVWTKMEAKGGRLSRARATLNRLITATCKSRSSNRITCIRDTNTIKEVVPMSRANSRLTWLSSRWLVKGVEFLTIRCNT